MTAEYAGKRLHYRRGNLPKLCCKRFGQRQPGLPAQGNTNLPGLGYRGFILHRPETLRVYRGQIIRETADKVGKKEAAGFGNRELELWLLQTAKTHLDPALWNIVRDALR